MIGHRAGQREDEGKAGRFACIPRPRVRTATLFTALGGFCFLKRLI
jgi:hypothetical protein